MRVLYTNNFVVAVLVSLYAVYCRAATTAKPTIDPTLCQPMCINDGECIVKPLPTTTSFPLNETTDISSTETTAPDTPPTTANTADPTTPDTPPTTDLTNTSTEYVCKCVTGTSGNICQHGFPKTKWLWALAFSIPIAVVLVAMVIAVMCYHRRKEDDTKLALAANEAINIEDELTAM
ncbi:uncharacterized protein LOC141907451 [Tubulanus polymorphus]|uniref:uncharacterized protein LOC141907451 n=1 Tax=Tubulanus polymorphus TaxID=672921 RepID=UPI003DA2631D